MVLGISRHPFTEMIGEREVKGDGHVCPKCFRCFGLQREKARKHEELCNPSFERVEKEEGLLIARVDKGSSPDEREICVNLAYMSKWESGWDIPLYNGEEGATCFVALDPPKVLGYACFRRLKSIWCLWDIWVAVPYRGKRVARESFHME
jgi:hypothetical protein